MNDLIIGLLSGAILASGTFTWRNWRRKDRLKQPWLQLQGKSEQLIQENQALTQKLTLESEINQSLRQEISEQQQQFQSQQKTLEALQQASEEQQQQLQAEQELNQGLTQQVNEIEADNKSLAQDRDDAWDYATQASNASDEKQASLNSRIQELEAELATVNNQLTEQAHSLEEALNKQQAGMAEQEHVPQLLLNHFLPNLIFLRESVQSILNERQEPLNALLATLYILSDGSLTKNHQNNGIKIKKVHATANKWSEIYHFPQGNKMMRIYFEKSKQGNRYQVLIEEKKDQKGQDQTYAWLKQNSFN